MIHIEQRPLEHVPTGTIVASDVHDGHGNLLLKGGSTVTERALEQLRRRGVTVLPVAVEESLTSEQRADRRAAIEAKLSEQFSSVRDQPLMEQLYQVVLRYRLEGV